MLASLLSSLFSHLHLHLHLYLLSEGVRLSLRLLRCLIFFSSSCNFTLSAVAANTDEADIAALELKQ